MQEVFFRILKYRHTYQPETSFRAWMYQVGRNVWLDQAGRRKGEVALPEERRRDRQPRSARRPAVAEQTGDRATASGAGRDAAGKTRGARHEPVPGIEVRRNRLGAEVRGGNSQSASLSRAARTGRPVLCARWRTGMSCDRIREQIPEVLAGRLDAGRAREADRPFGNLLGVPRGSRRAGGCLERFGSHG